jgi:hypothetical protein
MSGTRKQIAVVIATGDHARAAEALRAAVGLGLRGDAVSVAFAHPGGHQRIAGQPAADKALATLELLGQRLVDAEALPELLATANAVEVWT